MVTRSQKGYDFEVHTGQLTPVALNEVVVGGDVPNRPFDGRRVLRVTGKAGNVRLRILQST
jgi:hypothetical protein